MATYNTRHFSEEKEYSLAPEEMWSWLSNTDEINQTIGLPPITYDVPLISTGNFHLEASTTALGLFPLK